MNDWVYVAKRSVSLGIGHHDQLLLVERVVCAEDFDLMELVLVKVAIQNGYGLSLHVRFGQDEFVFDVDLDVEIGVKG